ncbi:hypothetical protein CYLTODRAFT_114327 [Cylindrobasidium torrendii FP15055 ss-10]|uniref:Uncharacterized protein n=1 Tax=Cylindrobasidium torrendii FP15055 ss-10 TaxID=1314674 RepID=A0A0D7B0Q9_9AGAR|nr:hypothetical protein CYLTODRAFT_114327 [Cylindrobasidium torrendii FP15055 ss-10]
MPSIPGEPTEAPKPQPIGSFPLILLVMVVVCCGLFLLWRRSNELRTVIALQLKTWRTGEEVPDGAIRLSVDEGPTVTEFLEDTYDEDNEHLNMLNRTEEEELMTKQSSVAVAAREHTRNQSFA